MVEVPQWGTSSELTELLWIGCLTGLISTPRFKSVTLTPNTNSQTCWRKAIFTCDEWNNLLHLFNVSHFSSTCCTKNFSLIRCSTMAKRIQDQKEEAKVASKSRPAAMNLSSYIATSSSTASSPIASKSLWMPTASGKPDSRMSVDPSSFDAAWTCQVRLKDANFGGFTEKQRRSRSHQAEEDSEDSGTTKGNKLRWNPLPKTVKFGCNSPCTQSQFFRWQEKIQERHGTTTSKYRQTHPIIWKPSSPMVKKIYGRQLGDPMKDLDVNLPIWWQFMNATLQAAVHHEKDYDTNLSTIREETISGILCDNYSMKQKDWSVINQKSLVQKHKISLVWKQLNSKKCGDPQASCAKEFIRSFVPKCTSSQTQCFVW